MRITIYTAGSRGDIEPFALLGGELAGRGHDVVLATHEMFRPRADEAGIGFFSLPGDPMAVLDSDIWDAIEDARTPLARARAMGTAMAPLLDEMDVDLLAEACDGSDGVVFSGTMVHAREAAERSGIPAIFGHYEPVLPTRDFPEPLLFPRLRLGSIGNLVSYAVGHRLLHFPLREPLRPRSRRALGLPGSYLQRGGEWPKGPVILGFSPALVRPPRDWPDHVHVTGPWDAPADPVLPQEVQDFLESGPPPVYVGFGSMRAKDGDRLTQVVTEGLREAGERAIIGRGWADLGGGGSSSDWLTVGDVSRATLFRHVKSIVHHGGTGTTHESMRAGKPTLVVPFAWAQHFWGTTVERLGAGPRPIPQTRLTGERLAGGLAAMNDPGMRERAAAVGRQMQGENGLIVAADLVESELAAK